MEIIQIVSLLCVARLKLRSCGLWSVLAKGVSFVVPPHVVIGRGRRADRVDARPHLQAYRRGFFPAEHLDGARQGSEDRLGAAAAGALPGPPCGLDAADPAHRAEILVCRLYRFCDPSC